MICVFKKEEKPNIDCVQKDGEREVIGKRIME